MTCSASTLDELVNVVKITVSDQQQENAREMSNDIKDVKKLLLSGSGETKNEMRLEEVAKEIKDEINDLRNLLASKPAMECECDRVVEPSKQALVSALVCEYVS